MRTMRFALIGLLTAGLLMTPTDQKRARACGWSSSVETVTYQHPDLPLDHFAAGRLGILRPGYARSYLVVAYRHLQGIGLSGPERMGARELWNARVGSSSSSTRPEAPWIDAKHRHLGTPKNVTIQTGWNRNYAMVENCLPDAFAKAAATLDERVAVFGAQSDEVRGWVERQDAVFAHCDGSGGSPLTPVPAGANPLLRADAAYQLASASFYAGDYAKAEQLFGQVARDPDSPHRHLGKYLAARAITRQGMLAGPNPSLPSLSRAEGELRAVLSDAGAKQVHGPAKRYLQFLRFRTAPEALQRELALSLAQDRLDADFQAALDDYTSLLDRYPAPMALTAPTDDRLSTWIGVVQSDDASAFDRAHGLYQSTKSPVWLVAALMKASPSLGPRIDPLLQDAAKVTAGLPGYASTRYHRIRLLAARQRTTALFQETKRVLASLRAEDGRSTRNALLEQAVMLAPTFEDLLDHAVTLPAGVYEDGGFGLVQPSDGDGTALHPEAAALLSSRLTVARLAQAAKSSKLPRDVRARIAVAAWTRAVLLADRKRALAVAPTVVALNPGLRAFVDRNSAAKSRAEERLALLEMLLEVPEASTSVVAWRKGELSRSPIRSSYDTMWWCGLATAGVRDARFLSNDERRHRDREIRHLERVGSGPTFLATEASELAGLLPKDPRMPRVLHLAVRATRYGCKDGGTTSASRRAFRVLHGKYPNSEWTKRTPYHY